MAILSTKWSFERSLMTNNAKKSSLFIPSNFFMVRTPLLSFDHFQKMKEEENFATYIKTFYSKNGSFQEAIAIASPSLKQEIEKQRDNKDTIHSLLKYFSRMTSRSTPFGLFAFVSYGIAGSKTVAQIDLKEVIKRARPDMEWLQNVIEKICLDEHLFLQLPIQRNPLLTLQEDRFCVGYLIKKQEHKSMSIRNTPLTKTIFKLTENSIRIEELICKILLELPDLVVNKIQEVIKTLIEQQFLWFSLLPSLVSSSPFQDFLKKIPPSYLETLSSINKEIEKYSDSSLGNGQNLLINLSEKMKVVVESKSYLQVDIAAPKMQVILSQSILDDVALGVEVLWRIPTEAVTTEIQSYFNKFVQKYGSNRLVSLYELLDETRGLGLPDLDKFSQRSEMTPDSEVAKFKQWQMEMIAECLWSHKQEIEITEDLIKKWSDKPEYQKAPLSADVFFELFANSTEEIDQGKFLVTISGIVPQGCSTFGRFLDMFDEDLHTKISDYYKQEEKLDVQSIFVESSYLPSTARSQNVSINPNFRKKLINLSPGGAASLAFEDIYIGARDDHFFLTSKDGKEEYYVTAMNVLNSATAPIPLRFLREVSRSKYQMCKTWSWGSLSNMPFLPRVRFNRMILSLATWNVNLDKIGCSSKDSIPIIAKKFCLWADQFQMVRYIFITESDNKLLFDRLNADHIEILAKKLKQSSTLLLVEKIGQEEGQWITSQEGKHCSEFVLPLLKNTKYTPSKIFPVNPCVENIPLHVRWRLPGSDWLFTKLYISKNSENRFLRSHLNPFVQFLQNQNHITQWFFIRYMDDRPHLRIRFNGNHETLNQQVLPLLHDWSSRLIHEGLIQEISLSSYEREIERYGGIELITSMEKLFCADSIAVMKLLEIEKESQLPPHVVGALSILDLLTGLNFNTEQQRTFFQQVEIDKSVLTGFKEWRKTILSSPPSILKDAFEVRMGCLQQIAKKIEYLQSANLLTASPFSIASSLIHMHCNRLLGTDSKIEKKVRAFAGYALQKKEQLVQ